MKYSGSFNVRRAGLALLVAAGAWFARSAAAETPSGILSAPLRLEGNENAATLHLGGRQITCDPPKKYIGAFVEFNARTGEFSGWKDVLDRSHVAFFHTNLVDRDFRYILYGGRNSIFHFILGEKENDKYFLAEVVGGWYRVGYAERANDLKLPATSEPPPRIADAEIDVSKNIVTMKKGGWTLPLFSKTGTYLRQDIVFVFDDANGRETVMRADIRNERAMEKLYSILATANKLTVIAPPDSPLHRQFDVPEKHWSRIMRLQLTPQGEKVETIPIRLPRESYVEKVGEGHYVCRREGVKEGMHRLIGEAPGVDFGNGMCYAATFDNAGERVVAARSFRESRVAAEMMLNRPGNKTTLLICGRNSEFLKKYYPQLADRNVLFAITAAAIRHAAQHENGDFRIPAAAEPFDSSARAEAHLADGVLILSWGNASYAIARNDLDAMLAKGFSPAAKMMRIDPAKFTFFNVNNPAWLPDIAIDLRADFLLLGSSASKLPEILKRKAQGKYFIAVSRGFGWEFFWNDRPDIVVDPRRRLIGENDPIPDGTPRAHDAKR